MFVIMLLVTILLVFAVASCIHMINLSERICELEDEVFKIKAQLLYKIDEDI